MRLPCRRLADFALDELSARSFAVVGCLSFEQRCTVVPIKFSQSYGRKMNQYLFELTDPPGGVPDYSQERAAKVADNRRELEHGGVCWTPIGGETVASEDALLRHVALVTTACPETIVLDITAIPKRVFCFLLKRLMGMPSVPNLFAVYTEPGREGYTNAHLAADVMTPEPLPGFAGKFSDAENHLVASIGFEALGLRKLILTLYREDNANLRVLLPFPAPLETVRRQWNTLREIMEDDPGNLRKESVAVIAAWDAEQVYHKLVSWASSGARLTLAPYGPKPHTLGMALFAIKHDASLWYTQPKVYHFDYSRGAGDSWWYVLKWQGIQCFDRS